MYGTKYLLGIIERERESLAFTHGEFGPRVDYGKVKVTLSHTHTHTHTE